jgi:chorismate lyase/3-hydroxybenzoate synthase
MGLALEYLEAERAGAHWEDALGAIVFGTDTRAAALPATVPQASVCMPVLGGAPLWIERWRSGEPIRYTRTGAVQLACTSTLVFGTVSAAETVPAPAGRSALEVATEWAYGEIHSALARAGWPHLLRVWNYLPDINVETHGLERYRQFNAGRRRALLAGGLPTTGAVPAASALGCARGPLSIYFLAARSAPRFIENPRQVSAYHYPREYGPRAPSFSRATVLGSATGPRLFISGTSSIVGHRTLHAGDPAAQSRETLTNIEALLAQIPEFTLADLAYKIYVRHAADLPLVQREVDAAIGTAAPRIYLQADVCRAELAVEIEATGGCAEP